MAPTPPSETRVDAATVALRLDADLAVRFPIRSR
jgi:hypothetical protein